MTTATLLMFLLLPAVTGVCLEVTVKWLTRKHFLDHPNERSSHVMPTPRGAGLAIVPILLLCWGGMAAVGAAPPGIQAVIAGALLLLAVSWRDDHRGLSAPLRLAAHGMAAAAGLAAMPATLCVFHGALPLWADRTVCLVAWVWFINLYNFMDGIDGLSGVESVSLGIGIGLVSPLLASAGWASARGADHAGTAPEAYAVAAVSIGFLWWNWQPARIFLGDSGSVPLGYLLGWLLLDLAMRGLWLSALILPAYYLADATLTLARRLRRGEKVWQAHRSHFYQMAVRAGASHAAVATLVLIGDMLLIGLAILAPTHPWVAAGGAAFVVTLMLATMAGRAARPIVR